MAAVDTKDGLNVKASNKTHITINGDLRYDPNHASFKDKNAGFDGKIDRICIDKYESNTSPWGEELNSSIQFRGTYDSSSDVLNEERTKRIQQSKEWHKSHSLFEYQESLSMKPMDANGDNIIDDVGWSVTIDIDEKNLYQELNSKIYQNIPDTAPSVLKKALTNMNPNVVILDANLEVRLATKPGV